MNEIRLYIGGTEVDFADKQEILYTYQTDDLTNPTIVKNSFSKTITVKGTKNNNNLFGHYWNVERKQANGGGNAANVYFNASKKMDFQLFVGTELYESGYVKLDEVRRINNNFEYDITLFGTIGDFFYNLTTKDDGEQMKLSNLDFSTDIDFTINIKTVEEAWSALKNNTEGKWQTINFMPCYNGIPNDFDSNKIVIDTSLTNLTKSKTEDGKTYTTKDFWTLAELPDNMTEWETRDLRTYLQRPCIRYKEIIKACCNPINNGGYEVELDTDFFNENNPYYQDTWMSLPMIQTLEYDSGEQTIDNATLVPNTTEGDANGYMYQKLDLDSGEFPTSTLSSIYVRATINPNLKYRNASYVWFWNQGGGSYHSGWWCVGSLFCQLLAFNGDTVIGASDVYNLTNPIRHDGKLYYGINSDYTDGHAFTPYMGKSITNVLGFFEKDGFYKENTSVPYAFNFIIDNLKTNVTSLKMCYYWGASKDKLKKADTAYSSFDAISNTSWLQPDLSIDSITSASRMDMDVTYHNIKSVMGGTIGRSGTEVTKDILLNTEATPCDYLLSYCKMFGLYFSKSPVENKIRIETRNTYYDITRINNITNDIDYSKNVTITPIAFGSKWVELSQEQDDTQYAKEYKTTKGITYGCKSLNTGYEFNSEKKQLLENNVLKSGIEALEKSKYFTCYNNDSKVRPFFGMGMKYYLYNEGDTIEMNGSNANGSNPLGINEDANLKYYDVFPKLQFHDSKGSPTDGNNCLVFFSGFKNLTTERANPISYYLTDDSYYQTQLNEGSPCWLFVSQNKFFNGKPIAKKVTEIPVFERYLTDNNGNSIKRSLDFGTPQELYIPKYTISEDANIYSNFWKTYLEDLYNVDTKILTAYVKLKGKVGYDMLKEFYWFENSIWRINKITDWNVGSEDTTKVEFVKVQDLSAYTTITQRKGETIKMYASKYYISPNGETIELDIMTNNKWTLTTNSNSLMLSKTNGEGDDIVTLTIPQTTNPTSRTYYAITATDSEGNNTTVSLMQGYLGETHLDVKPNALIVSSDGGDYEVEFSWKNQGENEITEAYFVGDIKGNVKIDGFNATISVTPSDEPLDLISGKVLFTNGLYEGEVLMEQIPQYLDFTSDGGIYEFVFNYNKDVTYEELPYWATMSGNTITVIPNYYEEERRGKILVSNKYSSAYIDLFQDRRKEPIQDVRKVTPSYLDFTKMGGLQYINIQLPYAWTIEKYGDWFTTNIESGIGNTIVSVSCGANTANKRVGIITVIDEEGTEYNVAISQVGELFEKELFTYPTEIHSGYEGGEYDMMFVYLNRNGDSISMETTNGLKVKDVKFVGDDITVGKIVVPKNNSLLMKIYNLTFKTSIGNITISVIQDEGVPELTLDREVLNYDYNGGSEIVELTTNIPWHTVIDGRWLSIDTASGESGTYTLNIIADTNTDGETRNGYIHFYRSDTNQKMAIITVKQIEMVEVLSVNPSSIIFDLDGGTETFTITSNTAWTIELN